ncbi:hypothetical protein BJY52DRAFT_1259629 [Lactarius psammicola]|nr:hypothetical protein BJY52DRAFT_1259629 [Lactarius psammicola]
MNLPTLRLLLVPNPPRLLAAVPRGLAALRYLVCPSYLRSPPSFWVSPLPLSVRPYIHFQIYANATCTLVYHLPT